MASSKRRGSPVRGVIFDMDGVLVDSEPLQMKVFVEMMRRRGVRVGLKEFLPLVGMRAIDNFRDIIREHGLRTTPARLKAEKDRLYLRLIRGPLKPMKGIAGLLKSLDRRGIRTALVSGSSGRDVRLVLRGLGMKGFFRIVVSGDDVRKGKPDPEGFLKASRAMGMRPGEVMVFEDSGPGVRAGARGGFRVLAVPTPFTAGQDFSASERVFSDSAQAGRYALSFTECANPRTRTTGRRSFKGPPSC